MTSSLTALRGLMLPVDGGDVSVWGGPELNAGMISILDNLLGGTTTVYSSNSVNPILTMSQAQVQRIIAVASSPMTITLQPSSGGNGAYVIDNDGSQAVTVTNGSGLTATILSGATEWVFVDNTSATPGVFPIQAPSAAPVSSMAYAFIFAGGTQTPPINQVTFVPAPFTSVLGQWVAYANNPTTCTFEITLGGNSIRGGNAVGLSNATAASGTIASSAGWTTTLPSGGTIGGYLTSVSGTGTTVTLTLIGTRTVQ